MICLDHQNQHVFTHGSDRCEVLEWIIGNAFEQGDVGGGSRIGGKQKGVAIGRRSDDVHGGNRATCTRFVFHQESLAQQGLHLLSHQPGCLVSGATCWKGHNKFDGFRRVSLRPTGTGPSEQCQAKGQAF
jgi:hypothetical protein